MKKLFSTILAAVLIISLFTSTIAAEAAELIPTATPTPVAGYKVIPEIKIEIPNSHGTQFILTNMYEKIGGEYGGLDYDLAFFYSPDSTIICNKDIYSYEVLTTGIVIMIYHYSTFINDRRTLLQTIKAGEELEFESFRRASERKKDTVTIEVIKVKDDGSVSNRQLHFLALDNVNNSENLLSYSYCPISVLAADQEKAPTSLSLVVNGKVVDAGEVTPYIDENNRTMVPVRFIIEALGANVDWNDNKQLVTIDANGNTITLTIGDNKLYLNGEVIQMDTVAVLESERTYVPVRFIAEALGMDVGWDDVTMAVSLKEK